MAVTVITDEARAVTAEAVDGTVLIDPADLPATIGWTLKPEGLCRDEDCVPVRDRSALFVDDRLDLGRVAAVLDRPYLAEDDVAVLGEPRATRRLTTGGLQAADFTLPDLRGELHSLEEWRGRKKVLIAFASW